MRKILFQTMTLVFFILISNELYGAEEQNALVPMKISQEERASEVLETMTSGGYTYVQIGVSDQKYWLAGKQFEIAKGDTVEYRGGMEMRQFYSKTLDKTFDMIYFMTFIRKQGAEQPQLPAGHMPIGNAGEKTLPEGHVSISEMDSNKKEKKNVVVKTGSVNKLEEGYTVEECFSKSDELNGKTVSVRGVIVKVSESIMNRNWIHIKDGTGEMGSNDLTVTSDQIPEVGDIVVVTGILTKDKDFGAGYFFKAIIEKGEIKKEGTY